MAFTGGRCDINSTNNLHFQKCDLPRKFSIAIFDFSCVYINKVYAGKG